MTRLAIITARGGSKRILHKNIRDFCGKPIINYSVEAALQSGVFDEVMVSTDDEKIAEIAVKAGAQVPFFRSAEAADDYATTAEVILEVLQEYEKQGKRFNTACCLYPTAPFITAAKLKAAVEQLEENHYDSVLPVVEFSFPPLRGMVMDEGRVAYKWEEYSQCRSQDLEKIYHDCGQFYMFSVKKFMDSKRLVTKNTGAIIVDGLQMQDIDNEVDWKLAELKYQLMPK